MPDINPADLARPAVSLTTPTLASKTITVSTPSTALKPKTSQIIPARIDLEPLYTALKSAIGNEQWAIYKESLTQFFIGRLNQTEFSQRIDPIITSPNGDREHLHNQLLAALYANVTREMPDLGLAPWVSANDKPAVGAGNKPVSGDAAERRLKAEVMSLPSRDRRRIKDLQLNEVDPFASISDLFTEHHQRAKRLRLSEEAVPSNGLNMSMYREQDIRKRHLNPLAQESGEFPEAGYIDARLLPYCYEAGLESAASDSAQLISAATETFLKEVLTAVFSRTRSNGPGESGSAGFGTGLGWIQTHRYKKQLSKEEDSAQRNEITRDKCGLLPIESKHAGERGPLSMGDLSLALDIADCGLAQFPALIRGLENNYRDGELEHIHDYTYVDGYGKKPSGDGVDSDAMMIEADKGKQPQLPNGVSHEDEMEIDSDYYWAGADDSALDRLDAVLESTLAVA
ncbi:transcriptional regulator of RNA polII, SAGA, subunit-domain-containing protein [Coniella lustricola]|uniref:Transcriptional regulator of RNA polII, SAGA, subunit-domain-containing protein n=1 Tax=Coniella lustricola TaxID=2025994 RepID=A0A2T3ACP2_9PEZI|nr:transcriptional regulator of RNA polII, SAGA, subunit-domain-containing protein [Coniella lustricola]